MRLEPRKQVMEKILKKDNELVKNMKKKEPDFVNILYQQLHEPSIAKKIDELSN